MHDARWPFLLLFSVCLYSYRKHKPYSKHTEYFIKLVFWIGALVHRWREFPLLPSPLPQSLKTLERDSTDEFLCFSGTKMKKHLFLFATYIFNNSLTLSFSTKCQTAISRMHIGQNIVFAVCLCGNVCFLHRQSHIVWKGSEEGLECLDWSGCNTSTADV